MPQLENRMMDTSSEITRIFDDSNPHWNTNPEHNRFFLISNQNYANHMLVMRGHMFLNEIFDHLGFERTRYGVIHGWLRTVDTRINFNITQDGDKFYLRFNVTGDIHESI